jgi:hypothetical protein
MASRLLLTAQLLRTRMVASCTDGASWQPRRWARQSTTKPGEVAVLKYGNCWSGGHSWRAGVAWSSCPPLSCSISHGLPWAIQSRGRMVSRTTLVGNVPREQGHPTRTCLKNCVSCARAFHNFEPTRLHMIIRLPKITYDHHGSGGSIIARARNVQAAGGSSLDPCAYASLSLLSV